MGTNPCSQGQQDQGPLQKTQINESSHVLLGNLVPAHRAKQSLSFKKLFYRFLSEQGMLSPGTWALITLCIPSPLQMEGPH